MASRELSTLSRLQRRSRSAMTSMETSSSATTIQSMRTGDTLVWLLLIHSPKTLPRTRVMITRTRRRRDTKRSEQITKEERKYLHLGWRLDGSRNHCQDPSKVLNAQLEANSILARAEDLIHPHLTQVLMKRRFPCLVQLTSWGIFFGGLNQSSMEGSATRVVENPSACNLMEEEPSQIYTK